MRVNFNMELIGGRQRKALQLRVLRSPRRRLTLIQKEFARRHFTELRRTQGCKFFLQSPQIVISIPFSIPAARLRTAHPRQRDMRIVRMLFPRNSQSRQRPIDFTRQGREVFTRLYADPKNPRPSSVGKKSVPAKA